eukprot:m.199553 g.199553  ORF g.199553 m.199553 type:complete len:65 (-) comp18778_c0_seq25:2905-3099(-)
MKLDTIFAAFSRPPGASTVCRNALDVTCGHLYVENIPLSVHVCVLGPTVAPKLVHILAKQQQQS